MIEYSSVYAPFINEYINFKRSLGYKYLKYEYIFKVFDHFIFDNNFTNIGLTKDICELWANKRPNESDTTRYKRINDIRSFSIFLNGIGYKSYVPRQNFRYKTIFLPYIFSKDEINCFFLVCDSLDLTSFSNTTNIYPAVFRLIYGCGLRANEALSIKCGDVNLEEKYIIIREPKNGEDRILPMSDTLVDVMKGYKTKFRINTNEMDFFFVKKNGNRLSTSTLYEWFRTILRKAGISHGGKGNGPRVHDLRHTYSVHALAQMAYSGLDLYYSLPLLSKYLGHKSLEATDKYVRLTADMYPDIIESMNKLCPYVFPEVD